MTRHTDSGFDPLWLVRSKVNPPRIAFREVRRAVIGRLTTPRLHPLTIVEAPAGYGKSTLLVQWADSLKAAGYRVAWLTLDEDDRTPEQFLSYLVAAIEAGGLPLPSLHDAVSGGFGDIQPTAAVNHLLSELDRAETPIVIMLDDYHRVSGSVIDRILDLILLRRPESLSLIVAGRGRPGFRFEHLRSFGHALVFDREHLRFTPQEISAYFEGRISEIECALLAKRTEGWPAAVQLAYLWLERNQGSVQSLETFSGRSRDLGIYLTEQVFLSLSAELQDFLLKTSIPDHFDAAFADALTGRSDSGRVIETLEQSALPITALDDRHSAYRYHHLFAEFLRDRLERHNRAELAALHKTAATWYASHGRYFEAARHATEAGEVSYAAELLERAGGWHAILRGGLWSLLKFRDLPQSVFRAYPHLRLVQIYLMAREGQIREARQAYEDLRQSTGDFISMRGRDWDPMADVGRMMVDLALRIYEGIPIRREDLAGMETILRHQPDADINLRALTQHLSAIASYDAGDFTACERLARGLIAEWRALGNPTMANYMSSYLARALFAAGRAGEAADVLTRTLEDMGTLFQEASRSGAVAPLFLAEIQYDQNDLATARRNLARTFSAGVDVESWFDLDISAYRTAASLAFLTEGADEALLVLDRAQKMAEMRGVAPTGHYVEALRIRILIRAGRLESARTHAAAESFQKLVANDLEAAPWVWRVADFARLVLMELDLASGQAAAVLKRMPALEARVRERGHMRYLLETRIIAARAAATTGALEDARAAFAEALEIAAPQGLLRPFLDHGAALEALLQAIGDDGLDAPARAFLGEIRAVLRGTTETAAEPAVDSIRPDGLSGRERDVLTLMTAGLSSKEIALRIGISESTVKTHRKNLYRKLNVSRRSEAIARATSRKA